MNKPTLVSTVEKDKHTGIPIMLTQAIIVACALCICEVICAPLYVSFAPHIFPILSWACVAIVLAVVFSYVVGFALLWCAESFAYRMKRAFKPIVYAITGAISFGVWSVWVVLGIMNAITSRLGVNVITTDNQTIVAINGALLGMAAFFVAFTLTDRIAKYRTVVIILGVITLVAAIFGGYILAMMMQAVAS